MLNWESRSQVYIFLDTRNILFLQTLANSPTAEKTSGGAHPSDFAKDKSTTGD